LGEALNLSSDGILNDDSNNRYVRYICVTFYVLRAVAVRSTVSRVVTPFSLVEFYQLLEEPTPENVIPKFW
jgi:hypothetical protein